MAVADDRRAVPPDQRVRRHACGTAEAGERPAAAPFAPASTRHPALNTYDEGRQDGTSGLQFTTRRQGPPCRKNLTPTARHRMIRSGVT